jgi:hypothetical protein
MDKNAGSGHGQMFEENFLKNIKKENSSGQRKIARILAAGLQALLG